MKNKKPHCAKQCLNNLLHGGYFSPVELSSIAYQLDEEEKRQTAEGVNFNTMIL